MPELFKNRNTVVKGSLVPYSEFRVLADIGFDPKNICVPQAVKAAEELLGQPVPQLPATLYMQYYRNGNRSNYEGPYFARRNAIQQLLMAELTEKKGRFTDLLVDYVWAVCEESTWVIPAHWHPNHGNPINCLPDAFDMADGDDTRMIDLFSAATGAMMAWVWYLGGDILDPVTPVIRRRILEMLDKRIFHVYYNITGENNWWMGDENNILNNWSPWIVSNVMTAVMLCETDDAKREKTVERSIEILDRFTRTYPDDGGCDEGPSYWTVAGASYFDCVEIIRDLTGGKIDLTSDPFVRKMCEYFADFNLGGNNWANFADAPHILGGGMTTVARMGRECGSDKLTAFAAEHGSPDKFGSWVPGSTTYREMRNIYEKYPEKPDVLKEDIIFYPYLGVMIAKNADTGFVVAAKGGHNAESHNHNDVGTFILYKNGEPVFIDPGVETYCKDTFSSKRYTLWTMRSLYHNLPEINGREQLPGKQYHAEIISCEGGVMKLKLKSAYPNDTGIESYIRTVGLTDTGFVCEDEIRLTGEGTVVFSLMCREEPVIADGKITVSGAETEYDPSLTPSTDTVPLDNKLTHEWRTDHLTRIRLASEKFTEKTFRLTVK